MMGFQTENVLRLDIPTQAGGGERAVVGRSGLRSLVLPPGEALGAAEFETRNVPFSRPLGMSSPADGGGACHDEPGGRILTADEKLPLCHLV